MSARPASLHMRNGDNANEERVLICLPSSVNTTGLPLELPIGELLRGIAGFSSNALGPPLAV